MTFTEPSDSSTVITVIENPNYQPWEDLPQSPTITDSSDIEDQPSKTAITPSQPSSSISTDFDSNSDSPNSIMPRPPKLPHLPRRKTRLSSSSSSFEFNSDSDNPLSDTQTAPSIHALPTSATSTIPSEDSLPASIYPSDANSSAVSSSSESSIDLPARKVNPGLFLDIDDQTIADTLTTLDDQLGSIADFRGAADDLIDDPIFEKIGVVDPKTDREGEAKEFENLTGKMNPVVCKLPRYIFRNLAAAEWSKATCSAWKIKCKPSKYFYTQNVMHGTTAVKMPFQMPLVKVVFYDGDVTSMNYLCGKLTERIEKMERCKIDKNGEGGVVQSFYRKKSRMLWEQKKTEERYMKFGLIFYNQGKLPQKKGVAKYSDLVAKMDEHKIVKEREARKRALKNAKKAPARKRNREDMKLQAGKMAKMAYNCTLTIKNATKPTAGAKEAVQILKSFAEDVQIEFFASVECREDENFGYVKNANWRNCKDGIKKLWRYLKEDEFLEFRKNEKEEWLSDIMRAGKLMSEDNFEPKI